MPGHPNDGGPAPGVQSFAGHVQLIGTTAEVVQVHSDVVQPTVTERNEERLDSVRFGAALQELLGGWKAGVLVPFVLAAALKSAQGSSTVAMITTAAIIAPMLDILGLGTTGWGPALAVVAIGCGSMTVSHANDSYFWVVSQMAEIPVSTAYRAYTMATGLMGVSGALGCFLLAEILLP